jgi:ATP-dependent RNA helicase RhlE
LRLRPNVRRSAVTFAELGLIDPLVRAVAAAGYENPTPIQRAAIPSVVAGRDLLGCAQTGTGKTAAFALPVLQRIDATAGDDPAIRALVLTPTRELAAQIGESFATYGENLDLWHTVIFGGVKENPQIAELKRGVDVLIATPGRLLDLMGQGHVNLTKVEIFVLDEADRMLDMGFLPDVKRVVKALPQKRQTLFFSATMPPVIRELAESLLTDPVSVAVAPVSSATELVTQQVFFVDHADKRSLLVDLLKRPEVTRTLVFTRTKHGANRIVEHLEKAKISAQAIHGNKSQNARTRAMDGFRDGSLPVLVATDLAARGIDVSGVSHVINFDLPNVPETYVHRIGRTGRAEETGIAWALCEDEDRPFLADIERLMKRHVERVEDHPYPPQRGLPPVTDLQGRSSPGASRPLGGGGGRSGGGGGGGRPGGGRTGGRPGSGGRSGGGGGGGGGGRPGGGGGGGGRSGGGGGRSGGGGGGGGGGSRSGGGGGGGRSSGGGGSRSA